MKAAELETPYWGAIKKAAKDTHQFKCYNETVHKIHKYADKLRWSVSLNHILNHLGET